MRILIVEDDSIIADNLKALLEHNHYIADIANTTEEAIIEISSQDYDIAIIDWMLPDGSGPEICRQIRDEGIKIPILMLTAKTQMSDIVQGLEQGADDYLAKPYRSPELLARIKALLRRKNSEYVNHDIIISKVIIHTNLRKVTVNNKELTLSPKEYELLLYLFRHKDESVDRLTLLAHIWGGSIDTFSNTVDVHIRYLRKKLGKYGRILKTVKGVGYCACES